MNNLKRKNISKEHKITLKNTEEHLCHFRPNDVVDSMTMLSSQGENVFKAKLSYNLFMQNTPDFIFCLTFLGKHD